MHQIVISDLKNNFFQKNACISENKMIVSSLPMVAVLKGKKMAARMKLKKGVAKGHTHFVLDGMTFCGLEQNEAAYETQLVSCERCLKIADYVKACSKTRPSGMHESVVNSVMSFRYDLEIKKKIIKKKSHGF